MALIIRGESVCSICQRIIQEEDEIVALPPFIDKAQDPLYLFSDSVFHKKCFNEHSLSSQAIKRLNLFRKDFEWPPKCLVCNNAINNPDEFFEFYLLTEDPINSLYKHNFTHFHKKCLKEFRELRSMLNSSELDISVRKAITKILEES